MGDYRDAQAQLAVCDYEEALSLMEEGGVEALRQAEADLAAMEGYGDSAGQAQGGHLRAGRGISGGGQL